MPETALAQLYKPINPHPPLYETPQALEKGIADYFKWCLENERMPTVAGMAYHLGFADRQSMYDYEKRSPSFLHVLKKARTFMESDLAHRAILGKGSTPGVIFTLKAMHGWQETQQIQVDINQTVSVPQLEQAIRGLLAQATPEQLEGLGIIDIEPDLLPAETDKGKDETLP